MRDKRTPRDVCGEATSTGAFFRFSGNTFSWFSHDVNKIQFIFVIQFIFLRDVRRTKAKRAGGGGGELVNDGHKSFLKIDPVRARGVHTICWCS